jgi:hypothetical protein
MPEQLNRAHYELEADPLDELERIVAETVTALSPPRRVMSEASSLREARDPNDFPRRDTSWRDPQVRTTVRAGVTPQPMPDQLAELEVALRSDETSHLSDATAPQYHATSSNRTQATNAEAAADMSGQVRGYSSQGAQVPDDEVTLPMHAVLRSGSPRPPAPPAYDPRVDPSHAEFNAYGRNAYPSEAAHDPAGAMGGGTYQDYAHEEAAFYEDEAHGQAHAHADYYAPAYDDAGYDDDAYQQQTAQMQPKRSTRSPLLVGGAIAAAVFIVGAGGFFGYRAMSRADVSGSGIPLIRADTKPVKEKVEPTQTTQVASGPNLDAARDGQDKLVSQTEDPVDKIPVKPAVRVVGTQQTTLAPVQRVHSVIVRPDGTIVSPETTASTTPAPAPTVPQPVRTVGTPTPETPVATAPTPDALKPLPPLNAPTQIASVPVVTPTQQRPTATVPVTQTTAAVKPAPVAPAPVATSPRLVKPAPLAPQPDAGQPLALAPKTAVPPPVKVATAPQATTPAQHPATVAAASGEFMVQVSSARSDGEARHALQQAVEKYAGLGVKGGDVQPADLGARGVYYRARLSGGSHEQAATLCQQIKAQGGDCVVARR